MNIIWTGAELEAAALGRIVRAGDVIKNVPDVLASQYIAQDLASPAQEDGEGEPVAPAEGGVAVPLMITAAMETQLKELGYTQAEINAMTPEQAHANLA